MDGIKKMVDFLTNWGHFYRVRMTRIQSLSRFAVLLLLLMAGMGQIVFCPPESAMDHDGARMGSAGPGQLEFTELKRIGPIRDAFHHLASALRKKVAE